MFQEGYQSLRYNTNLSVGTAIHKALQAHYKGLDPFAALAAYWAEAVETILPDDPSMAQVDKDVKLSTIMLEGYLEWLAVEAADAGLIPVAVEETVEMPLGRIYGPSDGQGCSTWVDDYTLVGTIDLVMADPDGVLYLIDHKTTASFSALTDRRMALNFQLLTYAVLTEQHFGVAPVGAQLNMLRKVLRTGTAKPPFYQRESVHFNKFQLDTHRQHILEIIYDMRNVEEGLSGVYPAVDADCTWKCPYLSVCPMADDGSDIDGALNSLYVRRTGD